MSKDIQKAGGKDPRKPVTNAQLAAAIGIGKFGASDRAEAISKMLRENRLSAISDELLREPIDDAFTLLVLLGLERQRGASLAEKAATKLLSNHLSAAGKRGAESLHSQRKGSREKAEAIRAAWATGKYKSRTECAARKHEDLAMSLETARKALRNTPDPHSR
ncbi:hypothetical protein [Cupriavidus campinensis]|uniref:hypothetical protein n=1 Tax=Cupriavidus campinensis TaxID=151783 RepID=UPI001BAC319C|nr:hypothetical protein [Cupriavidus campinensis]